jgi:hypothetical protein
MISPDAINWEPINLTAQSISTRNWTSVAYGNGVFVAVAANPYTSPVTIGGTPNVAVSRDGRSWTALSLPPSQRLNWSAVAYGIGAGPPNPTGRFVAVADDTGPSSSSGSQIMYSDDGFNWYTGIAPNTETIFLTGVCFREGIWIACARATGGGSNQKTLLSTNGVAWTQLASIITADLYDVRYGNGRWIAVGNCAGCDQLYGSNGPVSPPNPTWSSILGSNYGGTFSGSVAYSDGMWIVVDGNNTKYNATGAPTATYHFSTNSGTSWFNGTMPFAANWAAISYGNGQFVAIANNTSSSLVIARSGNQFVNDERDINENILQGRIVYGGLTVVCNPSNGAPPAIGAATLDAPNYYFKVTNIPQHGLNTVPPLPVGTVYRDNFAGGGQLRIRLV